MNPTMKHLVAASLAALLAGTTAAAAAQVGSAREAGTPGTERNRKEMRNATEHVNRAVQVVHRMQANPEMRALLQRSKGVFVVPQYGEAALGVGARGGAGVLLVRNGSTWSHLAFYNMGGISAGLQAGAQAGAIAFVLNDQKALNSFAQNNKFSLGADADLTLVDWSKKGAGSADWGNITAWSDTEGLFGGAAINLTDIDYDEDETSAYYKRPVAARDVLSGKVTNPQADMLRQALANTSSGSAASSMGGSGARGTTGSGKEAKSDTERERSR
ncbi:lipid-binding SYLF domain-containing protein [Massilia sp. 9I]|uniref:lipid-binding SYLF domain-containing protein n=1 Tax=Massilia sp. 9I TaxID=2653152 RepID=UPI0012F3CF3A|nr:lipid-binding SYLF domain-containing protein [Massilia sp. 9I]VXC33499.1 Putative lipoprotein [Massilia sp. 9I]